MENTLQPGGEKGGGVRYEDSVGNNSTRQAIRYDGKKNFFCTSFLQEHTVAAPDLNVWIKTNERPNTTPEDSPSCLRFWRSSSQNSQTSAPSSVAVCPDWVQIKSPKWGRMLDYTVETRCQTFSEGRRRPHLFGRCRQLVPNLCDGGRFGRTSLGCVFSRGRRLEKKNRKTDMKNETQCHVSADLHLRYRKENQLISSFTSVFSPLAYCEIMSKEPWENELTSLNRSETGVTTGRTTPLYGYVWITTSWPCQNLPVLCHIFPCFHDRF